MPFLFSVKSEELLKQTVKEFITGHRYRRGSDAPYPGGRSDEEGLEGRWSDTLSLGLLLLLHQFFPGNLKRNCKTDLCLLLQVTKRLG